MACLEELAECAEKLKLSPEVQVKAKTLLEQISLLVSINSSKLNIKTWVACAVYAAIHDVPNADADVSEKSEYDATVSQLLAAVDINIMEFFQAMCCLKQNDRLTDSSKRSLIALERKYCIVSAIYDKFENMISDVVNMDSISQDSQDNQDLVASFKAFSWYLFLVAKAKVFWHGQDLLAIFHLLLCCIAEVIKFTPSYILLPPLDNIAATSSETLAVLQVLSSIMNTAFDEAKVVYECWLHVASELMEMNELPQLAVIKSTYHELYIQSGDIDESLFLVRDWHIVPSSESSNQNYSPRKNVPTIRRTLDTVQALYSILKSAPNDFSPALKQLFQKCNENPRYIIHSIVKECGVKFANAFAETYEKGNSTLGQKRFELALKYYYLMLNAMVQMEAARLSITELTAFLKNETFHRSLLACCTEVVIMSCGSVASINYTPVQESGNNRVQGLVFPWVLEVFELKAYHFFKVIESFIKTAPTITQEIIRHLKNIEEKILLSLAWKSDSPIFEQFNSFGASEKTTEKFWSQDRAAASSSSQNSSALSPAVNLFINKVSRLAGTRMKSLCNLLQIREDMLDEIWVCIEHVIYQNNQLLKDRHLDQMIMCCIYAVCKALNYTVSFKDIILCYTHLPHSAETVYKKVLTNDRREYIISFYNSIFTGAIRDYIENQFPSRNKNCASRLNALDSPLSPSYSLPGRRNIFISPLKQPHFKDPNEVIPQRAVHSYCIGALNQPANKLQAINEALRDVQGSTKHPQQQQQQQSQGCDNRGKKRVITDVCNVFNSRKEGGGCPSPASAKKYLKFD